MISKSFILVLLCLALSFPLTAQENANRIRIGMNYGQGSQEFLPIKNKSYAYDTEFYKIQFNYLLFTKKKWRFELNVEPGIYVTEHQLLNEYYISSAEFENEEELIDEYTTPNRFQEYVLNIGFVTRYPLLNQLSLYNLISVGPMFATGSTERLPEGFAFSDIIAMGIFYTLKNITLDFRYSLRHVSNANLKAPNAGHNSAMLESGVTFLLQ